jgi:hypothetical protein
MKSADQTLIHETGITSHCATDAAVWRQKMGRCQGPTLVHFSAQRKHLCGRYRVN